MPDERIVAIGLLTKVTCNGSGKPSRGLWPVDQSSDFSELLRAIDEAEENHRRNE